jgi:hypothetical protein
VCEEGLDARKAPPRKLFLRPRTPTRFSPGHSAARALCGTHAGRRRAPLARANPSVGGASPFWGIRPRVGFWDPSNPTPRPPPSLPHTLGVWPRTLPARAKLPCTLPAEERRDRGGKGSERERRTQGGGRKEDFLRARDKVGVDHAHTSIVEWSARIQALSQ